MNHPMPSSPLPWGKNEDRPSRPYTVAQTSPHDAGPRITSGEPSGGGPYYPHKSMGGYEKDRDYIVWAANNAPKLAERVAALEAALRAVEEQARAITHISNLPDLRLESRTGAGDAALRGMMLTQARATAHTIIADIRKALEAK